MTLCPKIQRSGLTVLAFARTVTSLTKVSSVKKHDMGMAVNMVGRRLSPEVLYG